MTDNAKQATCATCPNLRVYSDMLRCAVDNAVIDDAENAWCGEHPDRRTA